MSKIILCLDTSSPLGSLALFDQDEGKLIAFSEWEKQKSHSEVITNQFQNLISDSGIIPNQIQSIVVGNGPGSFTGIRVGLSFAKSLAYSFDLPTYSINSLEVRAHQIRSQSDWVGVLVNAFRNKIYFALYDCSADKFDEVHAPEALKSEEILEVCGSRNVTFCGDAFFSYENSFERPTITWTKEEYFYPKATTLGELFLNSKTQLEPKSWDGLLPLYIRSSEAEEKLKEGLLKIPEKL